MKKLIKKILICGNYSPLRNESDLDPEISDFLLTRFQKSVSLIEKIRYLNCDMKLKYIRYFAENKLNNKTAHIFHALTKSGYVDLSNIKYRYVQGFLINTHNKSHIIIYIFYETQHVTIKKIKYLKSLDYDISHISGSAFVHLEPDIKRFLFLNNYNVHKNCNYICREYRLSNMNMNKQQYHDIGVKPDDYKFDIYNLPWFLHRKLVYIVWILKRFLYKNIILLIADILLNVSMDWEQQIMNNVPFNVLLF